MMQTQKDRNTFNLLADVGGTNTRLALAQDGQILQGTIQRLRNDQHTSLDSVLAAYFSQKGPVTCDIAAAAIAAPIEDGVGRMTNLNWQISAHTITKNTGATRAIVINDLQAQGYALGRMDKANLIPVISGKAAKDSATRLVVGLGTGFNAVPVFTQSGTLFVPPSETGHTSLPIRSETEYALAKYLAKSGASATLEDLLSGKGLARAYGFFSQIGPDTALPEPAWVIQAAHSGHDESAVKTLNIFVHLLGRSIADLANIHLPFGGIYLVGGVARAVTPFLDVMDLKGAFRGKGKAQTIMENFPIYLVDNDFAALDGCLQVIEQSD